MNTRCFPLRVSKSSLSLVFLFALICGNLSTQASAQSRGEVVSIARKAAAQAAFKMMKTISPNTGKDADYELDYESIMYDPHAKEIECRTEVYWSAKEYVLSSGRNMCVVYGKLYIDLSKGKYNISSRFVPLKKNAWTEVCADSHWGNVASGIVFYISMK